MNAPDLYARLTSICEKITHGDYEEAKNIFNLPPCDSQDSPVNVLAEALGMMLVRIEAREFELRQTIAALTATREELMWHKERLARENSRLRAKLRHKTEITRPVASAPVMLSLMRQAERAALVDANLLITGETGTGKGMIAHYIHALSDRSGKPFVAINCAAIPATLLESELFGIEAGVASGVKARIGRFEQATGGTILLDEIGDMPLESQAKLLHVIETGTVERVGGRKPIHVGARIMAATHRELEKRVEKGRFRADLFYRLNVMRLHIPPLRERPEDIPLLTRLYLGRLAEQSPLAASKITAEAMALLVHYAWPGNIRELENELERAALLAEGTKIQPQDLSPMIIAQTAVPMEPAAPAGSDADAANTVDNTTDVASSTSAATDSAAGTEEQTIATLADVESAHILATLHRLNGNKSKTAQILGISREALRLKLKRSEGHSAA